MSRCFQRFLPNGCCYQPLEGHFDWQNQLRNLHFVPAVCTCDARRDLAIRGLDTKVDLHLINEGQTANRGGSDQRSSRSR